MLKTLDDYIRVQKKCEKSLVYCMNKKHIEDFDIVFEIWHDVTSYIVNHQQSPKPQRLSDDVLEYARVNIPATYYIYYE